MTDNQYRNLVTNDYKNNEIFLKVYLAEGQGTTWPHTYYLRHLQLIFKSVLYFYLF
jgi:hypothetical protein